MGDTHMRVCFVVIKIPGYFFAIQSRWVNIKAARSYRGVPLQGGAPSPGKRERSNFRFLRTYVCVENNVERGDSHNDADDGAQTCLREITWVFFKQACLSNTFATLLGTKRESFVLEKMFRGAKFPFLTNPLQTTITSFLLTARLVGTVGTITRGRREGSPVLFSRVFPETCYSTESYIFVACRCTLLLLHCWAKLKRVSPVTGRFWWELPLC